MTKARFIEMYKGKAPVICAQCLCDTSARRCHQSCVKKPECGGTCRMVACHVQLSTGGRPKKGFMWLCSGCNSNDQCGQDPERKKLKRDRMFKSEAHVKDNYMKYKQGQRYL